MAGFGRNSKAKDSFLPEDYVRGKSEQRTNLLALVLFGVVLILVVGAFTLNHQQWTDVRGEQRDITTAYEEEAGKIDQLKALEERREALVENGEVVTALVENVPRSVLLAEVLRGIPEDMILSVVELKGERVRAAPPPPPDPKAAKSLAGQSSKPKIAPPEFHHKLEIEGLATLNSDVADFMGHLKISPLLAQVELQFINDTTFDGLDFRRFKISAVVRNDADARQVVGVAETDLLTEDEARDITRSNRFRVSGSPTTSE